MIIECNWYLLYKDLLKRVKYTIWFNEVLVYNLHTIFSILAEFGLNKKEDDSWRAIGLESE